MKNLQYSTYRKPSMTDTIIPSNSYHPTEQKMSAIYVINRMQTYPV